MDKIKAETALAIGAALWGSRCGVDHTYLGERAFYNVRVGPKGKHGGRKRHGNRDKNKAARKARKRNR